MVSWRGSNNRSGGAETQAWRRGETGEPCGQVGLASRAEHGRWLAEETLTPAVSRSTGRGRKGRGAIQSGRAKATKESPLLVRCLPPPPAAMTTYCLPFTE